MITDSGALGDLIESGARIMETACGFCIGNGQAPQTDAVSIRTNNRNFEGRSGTKSARVFLASPETAAVCALTGEITDPRKAEIAYPEIEMPDRFTIDDGLIHLPPGKPDEVEILRGPNIGDPPRNEPLPATLKGEVTLKVGDKITTDHIMPAGPRLKYRSNVPKYSTFVFENVDSTFSERCTKNRESEKHNFIVGGWSYGQGSSREHAALCPMYLGVKAVIARTLERIHTANLVNFGILPLRFRDEADYDRIGQGDELEFPDIIHSLEKGGGVTIKNVTGGIDIELVCDLSRREREIVLAGGMLNYVKSG